MNDYVLYVYELWPVSDIPVCQTNGGNERMEDAVASEIHDQVWKIKDSMAKEQNMAQW